MRDYFLFYEICVDLEMLMTGGLKSDYYIRILKKMVFDQFLNG